MVAPESGQPWAIGCNRVAVELFFTGKMQVAHGWRIDYFKTSKITETPDNAYLVDEIPALFSSLFAPGI
jgi:hypothetical protein